MKSLLRVLAIGSFFAISPIANANLITTDVLIAPTGQPGSVQQIHFNVTTPGDFSIDALGSDTLGAGFNPDPMMYLFANDGLLDPTDLLASDDDSGTGFNSHIDITLGAGAYILSVSEFFFDVDQAISGIEDSISDPNTYIRAVINSRDGAAQISGVPEPASIALLGLGLAGLSFSRQKRSRMAQ